MEKVKGLLRHPWLLSMAGVFVVGAAALGIWYARNRVAQKIVTGIAARPEISLKSTGGRTNVLLLGIGGTGHDGPDLTDSMILASIDQASHQVSMISIPRDIWVTSMQAKINTAYYYGSQKNGAAGGLDLTKSVVAEVTGLPVHYVVMIDFNGFVKAIDAIGGIDVTVDRPFDDYLYPIPGKEDAEPESARYEHIHFDAGVTHMDGTTALKFARSRHAVGEEGTDFARSARQQKIIVAFKNKLLSSSTLFNLSSLQQVEESFASSITTDIDAGQYGSFFKLFLAFEQSKQPLQSINIDDLLENPANTAPYQGQWVLVPKTDWQAVHDYVAKKLAQ